MKKCPYCGSNPFDQNIENAWFECGTIASLTYVDRSPRCESAQKLNEAREYVRKLYIKVTDQSVEIQRLKDAGDLLFEELDDKTPDKNCQCCAMPPCDDCVNHSRSRAAIEAWKATQTTSNRIVRYVEEVNGGMGPDYAEVYLTTGHVIQVNDEGLILWPSVAAYQSGENERIAGGLTIGKEANK